MQHVLYLIFSAMSRLFYVPWSVGISMFAILASAPVTLVWFKYPLLYLVLAALAFTFNVWSPAECIAHIRSFWQRRTP